MRSDPTVVAALKGAAVVAALVVLVDMLLGCLTTLARFERVGAGLLVALPVLVAVALGASLVVRAPDDRRVRRVALGILAFALVSRVVWVSVFDAYQTNDWGWYLRGALDALTTGHPEASRFCRRLWTRIVANTLLPVWLFGPSLRVVKGLNVLATTLTGWLWFETGVVVVGARVAALSLVFLVWQPDLWYAVNLASHDVPGMLWLVLTLFLAARLWRACAEGGASRPGWSALVLSTGLGLTVAVAGWSRGFDVGLLLALGCGALVETARRLRVPEGGLRDRLRSAGTPAGLLLGLPLLVWLGANQLFWLHTRDRAALSVDFACWASTIDVQGTGLWHETVDWWRDQCPLLPREQHWRFTTRKVLHELTSDPAEYLGYVERKNRIFATVGDYVQWAGALAPDPGDPTAGQVRWIDGRGIDEQSCAATAGQVVLLLLVLGRLLLYPAISVRPAAWPTLAFSALLYGVLLALLECQGRYAIFLILPFSWMAGELLCLTSARARADLPPPAATSRARLYSLGTAALALLLASYWIAARLLADGPLTLRDQRGFAESRGPIPLPGLDPSERVPPRLYLDSSKRLALGYRGGGPVAAGRVVAVERTFAVTPRPRHHLRFFLSTLDARSYPWQEGLGWDGRDFELAVAANERVLWHGTLEALGDSRYVSLEAPPDFSFEPRVTLRLVLRNRVLIPWVDEEARPLVLLEYVDLL